jgi:ubiquinone biosynthesis protein Coq4
MKALWKLRMARQIAGLVKDPDGQYIVHIGDLVRSGGLSPEQDGELERAYLACPSAARLYEEGRDPWVRFQAKELAKLPEGSLGHEYARFLKKHAITDDFFPTRPIRGVNDYFSARIRQTHDIWHVLTGFDPSPFGELGMIATYLAQVPSPFPLYVLIAGFLMALKLGKSEQTGKLMDALIRGYTLGKEAKPLWGEPWEDYWSEQVEDLRRRYGIRAIPA